MEANRRRRFRLADHLDVSPADAAAPPRAEHLHHRLLGGEPGGVALEATAAARLAVRLLALGEDPRAEAGAVWRTERTLDATDLTQVDADARDRRGRPWRH